MKKLAIIIVGVMHLVGCGSLSGFDAGNTFSCQAPPGVLCESMTGIYKNFEQNNLPNQRPNKNKADGIAPAEPAHVKNESVLTRPIYSGTPIRSAPRVLRVWFAPWEDTDGDLHDQSYVYLSIDAGRWLIEHNRRRIQDAYRPVRAPSSLKAPVATVPGTSVPNLPSVSVRDGMESIGTVQSRPNEQNAASMLGNIQMPRQIGQAAPNDGRNNLPERD